MALMAFQFENAEAIRIESRSNVTLANIASKAVVQVATALSSVPILPPARCRRGAGVNEEQKL
jgi:hypothetical protein